MLYLSADEIMQALSLEAVMDCVEEALRIYEAKTYEMPDRLAVDCGKIPGKKAYFNPIFSLISSVLTS